jgi:cell division inhibitor SepF
MLVVITHPQKVDDAGSICDYIKSGKTVVVNLEDTDFDTAQRVVDFLSGVSYSLDGDIQCVSNKIFILAPRNVDVTGQFKEELKENGFLFSFAQAYK